MVAAKPSLKENTPTKVVWLPLRLVIAELPLRDAPGQERPGTSFAGAASSFTFRRRIPRVLAGSSLGLNEATGQLKDILGDEHWIHPCDRFS